MSKGLFRVDDSELEARLAKIEFDVKYNNDYLREMDNLLMELYRNQLDLYLDNLKIKDDQKDMLEQIERLKTLVDDLGNGVTPPDPDPVKAFPTAYGAGANVTGGRGKPIYRVTNLNNSGPGSFRQCLEDTRVTNGGIIIFDVSGTINLTSEIYFTNQDNITILGQTAPEGGIAITNYRLRLQNVNNLIIRYLKIRPSYAEYPATEIDTFEIFDCDNYIIDHCSFAWGTDEVINSGNGTNYTWQRNLIAESNKTGAIVGALSDLNSNISFLNNAFYNCSHRFPNWVTNERVDIINNVVWSYRNQISVPIGNFQLNHIGNYYRYFENDPSIANNKVMMYQYTSGVQPSPEIYTAQNYVNSVLTDMGADNYPIWRWRFNPSGTSYSGAGNESALTTDFKVNSPFEQLGVEMIPQTALEAFTDVTNDVGANKCIDNNGDLIYNVDGPDSVYLSNMQSQTLIPYTQENVFNTTHRTNYLNSISNTPINVRPGTYSTLNDGIEDTWRSNNMPNGASASDISPSGYAWIEEYVNQN